MTEKQKNQRFERSKIAGAVCEVCGKSLYGELVQRQFAHRIGNTETNRKLYGSFFVDSVHNGKMVCSLSCNASVDVGKSKGNIYQVLAEILIKETAKEIGKTGLDVITDLLFEEYRKLGYIKVGGKNDG